TRRGRSALVAALSGLATGGGSSSSLATLSAFALFTLGLLDHVGEHGGDDGLFRIDIGRDTARKGQVGHADGVAHGQVGDVDDDLVGDVGRLGADVQGEQDVAHGAAL